MILQDAVGLTVLNVARVPVSLTVPEEAEPGFSERAVEEEGERRDDVDSCVLLFCCVLIGSLGLSVSAGITVCTLYCTSTAM